MRILKLFIIVFALITVSCKPTKYTDLEDGMYADLVTDKARGSWAGPEARTRPPCRRPRTSRSRACCGGSTRRPWRCSPSGSNRPLRPPRCVHACWPPRSAAPSRSAGSSRSTPPQQSEPPHDCSRTHRRPQGLHDG